ncbi:MAG: endopeptidase La, partial [Flavobacteriales bacterium]|nr:endopeptidase La [Flavobacteriales bacterium]
MKEIDFSLLNLSSVTEENAEFIPLLSQEDEDQMDKENIPEILPILPLRNTVLFPGVVIPITVGRDKSIRLVKEAYDGNKTIGVIAQKDQEEENPKFDQLNTIGTVASILKLLKMPDGSSTIIIQGKKRFRLIEATQEEPYIKARIETFLDNKALSDGKEFDALVGSIRDLALNIIKQSPNIPSEASIAIKNIESPSFLINFISSNMNASVSEKQELLIEEKLKQRAELVLGFLTKELQMLELKNDIQSKVRSDIDDQQREYFLHQQMKTIQEELGGDSVDQEIEEMTKKASKKKWSKEVNNAFNKELDKVQRMNSSSAEYSVQINYLEALLDLPWNEVTKDKFDLKRAQKILDRDHYGLEKVKERILEHLAVLKLKDDMRAPILCLYGPPGVGKTSLGKSIAEAIGRNYVRMSLGGLRDEAEVRGHRKTYIGAMPGRILQSIKKAKSSNPVFVLDEIDKVGSNGHGDPSSALLEVLDPEQNDTFYDNFVELDYDLSSVMFVATANSLSSIQPALRDRLEIIEVSGYTIEEKIDIAKKHLLPTQMKADGLSKDHIKLGKLTLEKLIEEYTGESGVRSLEKKLAKLCRSVARKIVMEEYEKAEILPVELKA